MLLPQSLTRANVSFSHIVRAAGCCGARTGNQAAVQQPSPQTGRDFTGTGENGGLEGKPQEMRGLAGLSANSGLLGRKWF